ncbi:MAG: helix-turn-helix domain-containing protein [Steroidobacteraceae bacterium]
MSAREGSRLRGRPRDMLSDMAIRDAAWTLLAESGYDNLTFEAVAKLAGCGRATLYRRFDSKIELVTSLLLEHLRELEAITPATSDPRSTILAHVGNMIGIFGGPRGRAWLNVVNSSSRVQELRLRLEVTLGAGRQYYTSAFRKLMPGAKAPSVTLALNMLIGTILHHVAAEQRRMTSAQLEALVEASISLLGSLSAARRR